MGFHLTVKSTSERAENILAVVGTPIKPHLPSISRFLIVATFFEDALRIIWQWKDQILYLENARHFPKYVAPTFLGFNATVRSYTCLNSSLLEKLTYILLFLSQCFYSLLVLY